jgi:hypothetical protein
MVVRHHWRDLGLFDKGFEAGSVACLFEFRGLAGRLAHELLIPAFGAGTLRAGEGWD